MIPDKYPPWPFLRTYKPMLKRAWNLPNYLDVRQLIQQWMWAKRIQALLERQNQALFRAASERDRLLFERRFPSSHANETSVEPTNGERHHGEQGKEDDAQVVSPQGIDQGS